MMCLIFLVVDCAWSTKCKNRHMGRGVGMSKTSSLVYTSVSNQNDLKSVQNLLKAFCKTFCPGTCVG